MPFSKEFIKSMGFPGVGDQLNGFNVESISVEHEYVKGSKPRQYDYPIKIVVDGKGSIADVEHAFSRLFGQRDVQLLSSYGNPYCCNICDVAISQLSETKFLAKARGSFVRTRAPEENENAGDEEDKLETLALKVYGAFFEDAQAVEVDHTLHPIHRTSRTDVKYLSIAGYSFIEQNPEKPSRWGEKAREGHKILWVTKGRRYVARVMDRRFLLLGKRKRT